jgi:hypothetical protein
VIHLELRILEQTGINGDWFKSVENMKYQGDQELPSSQFKIASTEDIFKAACLVLVLTYW